MAASGYSVSRSRQLQVVQALVLVVEFAQEHALQCTQVIRRRDDHAKRRDDGEPRECRERPNKAQRLADEAIEARQTERGHEGEPHEGGVLRHTLGEAAEAVDLAVVRAVVDDARKQEERGADDAVIEHLVHGAGNALRRECRHGRADRSPCGSPTSRR